MCGLVVCSLVVVLLLFLVLVSKFQGLAIEITLYCHPELVHQIAYHGAGFVQLKIHSRHVLLERRGWTAFARAFSILKEATSSFSIAF